MKEIYGQDLLTLTLVSLVGMIHRELDTDPFFLVQIPFILLLYRISPADAVECPAAHTARHQPRDPLLRAAISVALVCLSMAAYDPPVSWGHFAYLNLLLPTVVQAVLLVLLGLLSRLENPPWRPGHRDGSGTTGFLELYLGTRDRDAQRPLCYSVMMCIELALSLVGTLIWVYRTYVQEVSSADRAAEFCFSLFFLVTFVARTLKQEMQPDAAVQLASLIDIYTIVCDMFDSSDHCTWRRMATCLLYTSDAADE